MSKKTFEERIEKFLNSDEIYRFFVLPVGERRELVMEDNKRKKVEAFEKILLELKTPKGYTRKEVTRDTLEEFAICYNLQGKLAIAVDGQKEYLGFAESKAKLMAIAVKKNKAVILIYESSKMKGVYVNGVTDMKNVRNTADLYKTLIDLGFCEGELATYIDLEAEDTVMKSEVGNCNGEE